MPRIKKEEIDKYLEEICNRIYNQLGYGLNELIYEKALVEELNDSKLFKKVEYEKVIPLNYTTKNGKIIQIGTLRLDIIINDSLILELKAVETPLDKVKDINKNKFFQQIKRYGHITGIKKLYLINFGKKLEFIKIC